MSDSDQFASRSKSVDDPSGPASALDWARRTDMTADVLAHVRVLTRRRQRRRMIGFSFAFATAAVAFVLVLQRPTSVQPAMPQVGEVAVLPPRQQILPDGSSVELNDGAEIKVAYSETVRRVELVRGAAHFTVAKNPARPFVVAANGVSVRAVGTAFCVDHTTADIEVLVTEGQVAVTDSGHGGGDAAVSNQPRQVLVGKGNKTLVGYGEGMRDRALEVLPIDANDYESKLGWRMPKLDFIRTPLGEVLAMFNRYNDRQFVLGDASLTDLKISGTLRADKTEALKEYLRLGLDLKVEDDGLGDITIRR